MGEIDPKGTTMGRQLLHIDHLEVVSVCHIADGQQGEIGEVFVIDRIELIVFNQIGEMRKLKGDDPFRRAAIASRAQSH